jgi:glycosyltransferase involved in cell wall biosynthesis
MTKALDKREGPLRVVILTPGVKGMGGISRMMDWVDEEIAGRAASPVRVACISTRGDTKCFKPVVFLSSIMRVAFACLSGRCDVLHVNMASFGSTYRKLLLAGIARLTGTPYVVHLHGGSYREFWTSRPPRMAALVDDLFRNASRVLVLGSIWSGLVAKRVPQASSRTTILPNAVPRPAHASDRAAATEQEPLTIVFVGRLNAAKGVPQLVEALATMRDEAGWSAVLAGDGEVEGTREAVRKLGLAGRVSVPGWLSAEEVQSLWQRAGVFVLPSFIENLPLSIIEAFSHGVPVVATPVGSVPELVEDNRTGLLVAPGDSAALGEALTRLVRDPQLRESLATQGRQEYATHFELTGYVDRLIGIWADAARAPRVPAPAVIPSKIGSRR